MTEYVCHDCGVKTTLHQFLRPIDEPPTTDRCPYCGSREELEYL